MSTRFINSVRVIIFVDDNSHHIGIKDNLHAKDTEDIIRDIMWKAKDVGYLVINKPNREEEGCFSFPFEKILWVDVEPMSFETEEDD